jgi:hypothetical protein
LAKQRSISTNSSESRAESRIARTLGIEVKPRIEPPPYEELDDKRVSVELVVLHEGALDSEAVLSAITEDLVRMGLKT